MADDPHWDDIFSPRNASTSTQEEPVPEPIRDEPLRPRRQERRQGRGRSGRGPRRGTIVLAAILVGVVAGGTVGAVVLWNDVAPRVQALLGGDEESADYDGDGNGTAVDFAIVDGEVGADIAQNLADAGVTRSYGAAYDLLLEDPTLTFQPGTYSLQQEMSAQSALAVLSDPANRVVDRLVIPEGTAAVDVQQLLVQSTGLPEADVQAAFADPASYGLPAGTASLEGWLFPATYELDAGRTARDYVQLMVDTMKERLATLGVAEADQQRIVTFASLIQREAGLAEDYPKVARVFQNRLDQGMLLQSDATVAYGTGNTHLVTTTDEERADAGNAYNTYVHEGLPVGPISNPGDLALDAAVDPADGAWLFFVTVNLDTGETVFSDTFAEHQTAVRQWQGWMREHPEYG